MRKALLAALLLALTLLPGVTSAASKGIGISPAIQEVRLEEGQASVSFTVQLINSSDQAMDLQLSTLDFGALDEAGGIAFLGKSGQESGDYGLKQWMKLNKESLALEPGASSEVEVTITNDESLRPGGHYGAVIVSAKNANDNDDSVAVLPAASSLVLLKKMGGEQLDLQLAATKANNSLVSLPKNTMLKFTNTGNTHVVPRGTVELIDPLGKVLSSSVINETSAYVLPGSSRQINAEIKLSSQPWLPGRYKLAVNWRYDGQETFNQTIEYKWYIGKLTFILVIITSLLIILIMYIRYRRRPVSRGQ